MRDLASFRHRKEAAVSDLEQGGTGESEDGAGEADSFAEPRRLGAGVQISDVISSEMGSS